MKSIIILLTLFLSFTNSCRILSLSGGGSHGAFEAGVIESLVNQNNSWQVLAGVSAGSLNAAFFGRYDDPFNASQHLRDIWENLDNRDVFKIRPNKLNLLDSSPLKETIKKNLDITQYTTNIYPTLIGLTNIENGKFYIENILDQENVSNILLGSSAIPIVFPPVEINNSYYIDGGTDCNEIISQGINYCLNEAESNIEMDLILSYNPYMKFNNQNPNNMIEYAESVLKIIFNNYNDMTYKLLNVCHYSKKIADINLYYPKENIDVSILNFKKGKEIYNLGLDSYIVEHHQYC
ncbi:Patatin-like phospholipase [seawater metagenome]|uniref:Patatin-like phospholipase n=1 Tax=seawater metagenome TaxID=1561972 RepID=A0A5E8CGY7_9ZZZZ